MSGLQAPRRFAVAILSVLLIAWATRLEYIIILPVYAYSWDVILFQKVLAALALGANPYITTPNLNWPPLWMICLFLIDRVAKASSLQVIDVLRVFLIGAESIAIVITALVARGMAPEARVRRMLLVGLALNPITILLTCQHVTNDPVVVIWMMATLLALLAYQRSGEPMDWLLACFFLGMGVLTKTIPIALTPLLVPGARAATRTARALGAILLFGPSTLGLGVLFVLSPQAIIDHVFRYTAVPGRFGVSGLVNNLGMSGYLALWGRLSSLTIIALIVWGCVRAWSWTRPRDHHIVLLSGLILLAIPTLGPGFGPQYAFWCIPPLAVSYLAGSSQWRITLLVVYAVSAVTYVILYAFARDLGGALVYLWWSPVAQSLGVTLTRDGPRTWLTLPMFVSWVALLVVGIRELRGRSVPLESAI